MLRAWTAIVAALALVHVDGACNSWSSRYGKYLDGVCVCNATTPCDTVSNEYLTLKTGQVGVFRTSKAGDRLAYSAQSVDTTAATKIDFVVDPSVTYQTMLGFGGAFTDAAAINIYKLNTVLQQKLLDAYYSDNGIEYTVGRIPIASCDFSTSVYSYNPVVDDFAMEHFSIDVDRAPNSHKLELIHRVLSTSSRSLSIFASSWAPPTWMLTQNSTSDSEMKGKPGDKYWKALALYYSKFIDAYQAEGIKLWGMTVQNEPAKPILQLKRWQSLRLTPELERDFIKTDLGPLIKSKYPDMKLMAHDEQKPDITDRAAVFKDAEAMKYIDGIGVHWYKDLDFAMIGFGGNFDKLSGFHNEHPDKFILATEACEGSIPDFIGTGAGTKLGNLDKSWGRAENYANDITNDVANFAVGWTDWNIALDTSGGPNWAGNMVDAPILVDEKNGAEFYKQPMYYVMGHFAKFVPAGSVRISIREVSSSSWSSVERVAFLTPENRIVVVFANRRNDDRTVIVQTPAKQTITVKLPKHSIQTILWQ